MGKRKRHPPWSELPPELLREVGMKGNLWASEPMRGVCCSWNSAVQSIPRPTMRTLLLPPHAVLTEFYRRVRHKRSPGIDDVLTGCGTVADTHNTYYNRIRNIVVMGEACVLMGLCGARIKEINPKVVSKRSAFTMIDTSDLMRRTLRHAGGVWSLLARRRAQVLHKRIKPIHIERSPEHDQAFLELSRSLTHAVGFSEEQKRRMLLVAKSIP